MMETAILVNLSANSGTAKKRWNRLLQNESFGTFMPASKIIVEYTVPFDIKNCIKELSEKRGIRRFISAGGDGSVNLVVNSLWELYPDDIHQFVLGGIGLGSSNDFHKPYISIFETIPVTIDVEHYSPRDIGVLSYRKPDGTFGKRVFLINASVGLLAEANYHFNRKNRTTVFLKRWNVELAIIYTAVRTLFLHYPKEITVRCLHNDNIFKQKINSLSVLKNVNIAGSLKFNQLIGANDGWFGVNIIHGKKFGGLLKCLFDLGKGTFIKSNMPLGRCSFKSNKLIIESNEPMFVETDGEVTRTDYLIFEIYKHPIGVMSPKDKNDNLRKKKYNNVWR